MQTPLKPLLVILLLLIVGSETVIFAQSKEEYTFEVDEFTKKIWEWRGTTSISVTNQNYNQKSVFYPLKTTANQRNSQESKWSLQLESRWDWSWSRLFLNGEASTTRATISENEHNDTVLKEAYWQLAEFEPHSFELGKRVLRWGKGYAFNPVALLERAKDPENPEANREGLWLGRAVWLFGSFAGFKSSSLNLIYLPVGDNINDDYQPGAKEDNIWGGRLYALIGTTDLDLYAVRWSKNEISAWGGDFASNLTVNFEIHGEYITTEKKGDNKQESLLGLRYLTDNEITWISELFHNSAGLTSRESSTLFDKIRHNPKHNVKLYRNQLQQAKTLNKNYSYLKVSIKEPFDLLYFTPSLAWLKNLDDQSYNLIAQTTYTPDNNWNIQLSGQYLAGGRYSQYGENPIQNRFELTASYSF